MKRFRPGDKVDVREAYDTDPAPGSLFVGYGTNNGLEVATIETAQGTGMTVPVDTLVLSVEQETKNHRPGPVKVKSTDILEKGMRVDADSEYRLAGRDGITIIETDLSDCTFIGWTQWSGVGKHCVAEVISRLGATHYVPRKSLWVWPKLHTMPVMGPAIALVDNPDVIGINTAAATKAAQIDESIAKLDGLLSERRLRKGDRRQRVEKRVDVADDLLPGTEQGDEGFKRVREEYVNHPLFPIFMAAIEQAMHGKGERHGGNVTPFEEQPWTHYAKIHGCGFLTGQAAKKLEEAASTRSGQPFIDEMRGAIVYCGMSILNQTKKKGK